MKKLLLAFACLLVFTCSKDDSPSENTENNTFEGGTIFTSQIVEVNVGNASLETYNGTLGDLPLQIQRASDSIVAFMVPKDFTPGYVSLKIDGFSTLTVNYTIEETVLSQTPQVVIQPFFDYFEAYTVSLQGGPNYNLVNDYNTQLVNLFDNANDSEKELMAIHYKANKTRFDYVFTTDFSSRQLADSNRAILTKFGVATLACGVSTAIAILDPEPFTKAISTGVAIVSWFFASDFKTDFKNRNVKTLDVIFDSVEGQFELLNSSISFNSESLKSIPVSSNFRTLKQSDSQDTNANVSNFFTKNNIYTGFTTQINEAITFVNDNIFFSNISLLQDTFLNTTDVVEPKVIDADFINNFSFSLSNSNLTIVSSAFNNGNLDMQIDVIDEAAVTNGVETGTLDFTYQDDFNNINGNFDIEVRAGFSLFTDAAALKNILEVNSIDVSDSRWDSTVENEVVNILEENGCIVNNVGTNNFTLRVTEMNIENRNLIIMPEVIGDFNYVWNLNLGVNHFSTLPETIGNLNRLEVLNLFDTNLSTLPEEIGNLTNLRAILLTNNNLSNLPNSFWNLINLELIEIYQNQLTSIPNSVSNLINLEQLLVSYNQLTNLPASIVSLTSLTHLYIDSNQITTIPTEIGNLINLENILLSDNQLISVPASLGNLQYVSNLNIRNNPNLKCLPQNIWDNISLISYSNTAITTYGDIDCSQ
jgi:Leucine-rich repeat (LRR) protein